jgi:hypothetical protein
MQICALFFHIIENARLADITQIERKEEWIVLALKPMDANQYDISLIKIFPPKKQNYQNIV